MPYIYIYFPNTAAAAFGASSTNPFNLTDVGSYAAPAFADLGGDGDLEVYVGGTWATRSSSSTRPTTPRRSRCGMWTPGAGHTRWQPLATVLLAALTGLALLCHHCAVPGCTSAVVTTTIPLTVTVADTGGSPEPGLKVYAFDGATYTGHNKTTDSSGQAIFTLPAGDYRFRADKDGVQYWSNPPSAGNHCTVPGCTAATVTVGGQAMKSPGGVPALALADLGALLVVPLAVAALGRRKKWQRPALSANRRFVVEGWTWPLAGLLLAVGVLGTSTALAAGGDTAAPELVLGEVEGPVMPVSAEIVRPSVADRVAAPRPSSAPMPPAAVAAASTSDPLSTVRPAPAAQSGGAITVTRVITYSYDPLGRLVEADYSNGESFAYKYDAVGNRTAMTTTLGATTVTTYTYDAANRLTAVGGVPYTWDERGNLTHDGTFTYTYNAAGRMVRAESVTATLVYTYTSASLSAGNAAGLRVAQSVDGDVTEFAWDQALGLAQVLATSDGAQSLYGAGRIAEVREGEWAYSLPDHLGSVRQWTDEGGAVTYAAGYTPYGEELWQQGSTQSAWGYTGEWWTGYIDLLYLRSRWYRGDVGRFTSPDTIIPNYQNPQNLNLYAYVRGNPVNYIDPSGYTPSVEWWQRMLQDDTWRTVLFDCARRHNVTQMSDLEFAALMAAIVRIESGSIHGHEADYLAVVWVKSMEIWYNRGVLPWLLDETVLGEKLHLGYQTEGISNLSVETIANLRQGLVPDAGGNLQQTGIEVYDYSQDRLPGLYPFPGLTPAEEGALLLQTGWLKFLLRGPKPEDILFDIVYTCIDMSTLLKQVRQDQNIEYLAANLEAGAIRAQWEGEQPTAEVLSWWQHRGIVTMRDNDELKDMIANTQDEDYRAWLESVLRAQGEAAGYWGLASQISQEAIELLSH